MRTLMCAAGLLALASPALADTLQEVTTHGMVVSVGDRRFDVTYTPDGKFAVNGGQATGVWRIEGDQLCTQANGAPETCVTYPKDKKSGDTFPVTGAQGGAATVTIK